ncbi:hypothetical protein Q8F55_004708 [Vanrija albida]|uniref:Zn(2)-C6 fungal-type domain-containing protein n=1 Tax=Vanrija albida TaxID=181172 RepID=A0ABR3Q0K2_9TREE
MPSDYTVTPAQPCRRCKKHKLECIVKAEARGKACKACTKGHYACELLDDKSRTYKSVSQQGTDNKDTAALARFDAALAKDGAAKKSGCSSALVNEGG